MYSFNLQKLAYRFMCADRDIYVSICICDVYFTYNMMYDGENNNEHIDVSLYQTMFTILYPMQLYLHSIF